jgi:hypothetical protein
MALLATDEAFQDASEVLRPLEEDDALAMAKKKSRKRSPSKSRKGSSISKKVLIGPVLELHWLPACAEPLVQTTALTARMCG